MVSALDKFLLRTFFDVTLKPGRFEQNLRPFMYSKYHDPEKVHEVALELLVATEDMFEQRENLFDGSPELSTSLAGMEMKNPFFLEAGFDKNLVAINATAHVFGFNVPGTVV